MSGKGGNSCWLTQVATIVPQGISMEVLSGLAIASGSLLQGISMGILSRSLSSHLIARYSLAWSIRYFDSSLPTQLILIHSVNRVQTGLLPWAARRNSLTSQNSQHYNMHFSYAMCFWNPRDKSARIRSNVPKPIFRGGNFNRVLGVIRLAWAHLGIQGLIFWFVEWNQNSSCVREDNCE